jgi:hypothetical protein
VDVLKRLGSRCSCHVCALLCLNWDPLHVHRAPASPAFDADALLREQTERPSCSEEEAGKLHKEREREREEHSRSLMQQSRVGPTPPPPPTPSSPPLPLSLSLSLLACCCLALVSRFVVVLRLFCFVLFCNSSRSSNCFFSCCSTSCH